MRILPYLFFVNFLWIAMAGAVASAEEAFGTRGGTANEAQPSAMPLGQPAEIAFQSCFGAGYLPYAYPSFETCPCGSDGCFHPDRYYCGGKPYRQQWLLRWVRAHLGHGSMLDGYPCPCILPATGRAYFPLNLGVTDQLRNEIALPPNGRTQAE